MKKKHLLLAVQLGLLAGCQSTLSNNKYEDVTYEIKTSPMATDIQTRSDPKLADTSNEIVRKGGIKNVPSLYRAQTATDTSADLYKAFSDKPALTVTAEKIPLTQFINYVFGELLQVPYIMADDITNPNKSITININRELSEQELFNLFNEQLEASGNEVTLKEDIYYILPTENGGSRYAIGIGSDVEDVPTNANNILQIIPISYNLSRFAERSIQDFSGADVRFDTEQQSIFVRGRYADVLRTLDVFRYLDKPSNRSKNVALFELTYIDSDTFIEQIKDLLQSEGVEAGNSDSNSNLVFVPLDQVGSVAVFASTETVLNRVKYWSRKLDRPAQGNERNFFIYYPKFARASDLANSLKPLITGSGSPVLNTQTEAKGNTASSSGGSKQVNLEKKQTTSYTNSNEMVVDERSNAMIFNMSASQYNQLLPLMKQLDVLPKQILLELVIAEVTLSGDFKKGVEFFFSKGNSSGGTKGSFGVADLGGLGYLWKDGTNQVQVSAFEENKFVNVLSNPSLLVRDGVAANINIGTDIPVVTSSVDTEGDGTKVTQTIQYRKTGVELQVTPTVNSRGVVIMNISQKISNETDTSAGSSSPSIFERSLETEVIADSGQTIILGGIISENKNTSENKVPLLGDIPALGHLFRYDGDNSTKTELVMLVTPRIIERNDEWKGLIEQFGQGFENLKLPNNK